MRSALGGSVNFRYGTAVQAIDKDISLADNW